MLFVVFIYLLNVPFLMSRMFLTDLTSSFCKCVIIGDFNLPDID